MQEIPIIFEYHRTSYIVYIGQRKWELTVTLLPRTCSCSGRPCDSSCSSSSKAMMSGRTGCGCSCSREASAEVDILHNFYTCTGMGAHPLPPAKQAAAAATVAAVATAAAAKGHSILEVTEILFMAGGYCSNHYKSFT